MTEKRF